MNEKVQRALAALQSYDGDPVRIMEVCGTHTHEIFRLGIRQMLSEKIELISGPGCPVCVTPVGFFDEAVFLAKEKQAVIATFGDLIRVPGSETSLQKARGEGADVRVVYSPFDALALAKEEPDREIVFLSVGFETTTPSECLAVKQAQEEGIGNFSILTANKTMPKAYEAMAGSTDAFLYPGHVHAVIGTQVCEDLKTRGISGVCAGFTAPELITALYAAVKASASGESFFINAYPRVVKPEGSAEAQQILAEVMEPCDAVWRGIGTIPESGLRLKSTFAPWDARMKFELPKTEGKVNPACRCGEVLQGRCRPEDCAVFGTGCTPEHPIGACMVSGEGACAAFYLYGRKR